MKLTVYQIDSFATELFTGNPAAVIPLESWLPESTMQSIALENNLSETAFFVQEGETFAIRWVTPKAEVKLCGHATLASAFVLFNELNYKRDSITFDSLSGPLVVNRENNLLTLDFPNQKPEAAEVTPILTEGLGKQPKACYHGEDIIAVFDNEADILSMEPNYEALKQLPLRGVMVTALAADYDFIVRFFAPKYDIPEDPVTGSAYTQLTPFWSDKLGKTEFTAKQVSPRGGELHCKLQGDRVFISGSAVKYMEGVIELAI